MRRGLLVAAFVTGATALGLGASLGRVAQANPAATDPARPERLDAPACSAWEVDYKLISGTRLKITDTLMNAGDGTYDVGPGKLRLRFTDAGGQPGNGKVELLELSVTTKFTLESKVLGIKTSVTTDSVSRNTPDQAGVVARGTRSGNALTWSGQANGYRADGKLTCTGTLCGKLGAPPPGESTVQIGPYPVSYKPFYFDDGVKKVIMPFAEVARSEKPKQTTSLQLVGVETARRCVPR